MRVLAKLVVLVSLTGTGCMSDEFRRADGLTESAGNAIAANSVMQMVDPWQDGVQDTRLRVPAARGTAAASASAGSQQSQTMSTSGN
jgi:hypothetical protein